jgi:hypothetical protein
MPGKMARSVPRSPFGLPEVRVAVCTSRQSCRKAGKARRLTRHRQSSGESRLKELFEISGFWVRNRPLRSLAWLKELLYLGRNWSTVLFRRCFTALTTPIYPAWLSRVICACVLNVV